jgi:hypothetical protein
LRASRTFIGGALIAVLAVVVVWRMVSSPGADDQKSGLDHEPACIGDKSCAVRRVDQVSGLGKDKNRDAFLLAKAMHASLDRDDCDAATELAGGLERLDVSRATDAPLANAIDAALLGRTGYCATKTRVAIDAPTPASSIRLERGMCEGECPAYAVTVTSEGEITFEGAVYTAKKGTAHAKIDTPRARELFDAFERMGFAKRPSKVGQGVVDAATATLTLKRGTATITVTDGAACFATDSIEEGLCYLEERTDEIAATAKWVVMPRDR